MKKLILFLFVFSFFLFPHSFAHAQDTVDLDAVLANLESSEAPSITQTQEYFKARVLRVDESGVSPVSNGPYQRLTILITSGSYQDQSFGIEYGKSFEISTNQLLSEGDRIVVNKVMIGDEVSFAVVDHYRLNALLTFFGIFFILTIAFAGKKGFRAIIGLCISLAVIIGYIVPSLIHGNTPVLTCLIGALGILVVTLFLAHGLNMRTVLSLGGSLITLGITVVLAYYFVDIAHLFGLGSEDAFFLQSDAQNINIKGLLLGGMIIGVLGVLDDITTAQVAVVAELKRANMQFDYKELYKRAIVVGKEHIASLVNTLALAYAGVSLPLLLLMYINMTTNLWVFLNGELIAEEIARTLVGSLALLLAVPITTLIASYYFGKQLHVAESGHEGHGH
ncbi:YibE/F family protein [Candidatus Falkowbacteria bacterium]|nr:YibE/F family protein [Candidatus Falkowbacteria bacterium]